MMDKFKKQSKVLTEMAGKLADSTKSKAAKRISERGMDDKKKHKACKLAYMLLEESLDMYKSGEMTLDEAIEDFRQAAKGIDETDLPEGEIKERGVLEVEMIGEEEGDMGGGKEY